MEGDLLRFKLVNFLVFASVFTIQNGNGITFLMCYSCSYIPSLILVYACHFLFCAEAVQEPFLDADLLPTLQKMLDDPVVAVEVKFSALGLICSLANSSQYRKMNTLWEGQILMDG